MELAQILEGNWLFRVEHRGITIHSSTIQDSPIQGFKGEVELQVSLKRLLMENYKRWVHQLAELTVIDKPDPTEYIIRQVINTPWPLQQREVIMRSRLEGVGENGVALSMQSEPDYLPLHAQCHRVRHAQGMWVFTPNGHGVVQVMFIMHLDPGPDVPPPVSNAGLFEVPFYTLKNLKALLDDAKYQPMWPEELEHYLAIVEDDTPDTL